MVVVVAGISFGVNVNVVDVVDAGAGAATATAKDSCTGTASKKSTRKATGRLHNQRHPLVIHRCKGPMDISVSSKSINWAVGGTS